MLSIKALKPHKIQSSQQDEQPELQLQRDGGGGPGRALLRPGRHGPRHVAERGGGAGGQPPLHPAPQTQAGPPLQVTTVKLQTKIKQRFANISQSWIKPQL